MGKFSVPDEKHNDAALLIVDDSELIEEEELRGFSRTVAEIEWLLAALVVLYLKLPESYVENGNTLFVASAVFVAFVLVFHYIWFKKFNAKWKLAIETWVMIAFITFVLWHTGKIESPLASLYFIVIVTAATTLGKKITLLEVGLISACFLLLTFYTISLVTFSFAQAVAPLVQLFLMWFVAYLVAMLSQETGQAKNRIRHLSHTDSLTGLWNMRMFSSLAQKEGSRASRYGHPFSIIMFDADNLKSVNDNYGHEAGSAMISLVAGIIRQQLRECDVAARFGGDEFVAMLPETASAKAYIAAERVRSVVGDTPLKTTAGKVKITISVGIADFPKHGQVINEVLNKADKALYMSKRNGKNRSTIYAET